MRNLEIPERTAFFAGPGNPPVSLHNRLVQPAMLRLCECVETDSLQIAQSAVLRL